ncbi:MAG: hypothetical protein K8F91_25055, partial [Candidatus Obscuribacterales bacterium]|nr:hypothetical protein [Candidatus Obscuribacterales bacterium]
SDIYSFGCLMFEMLTGRLPFSEESIIATMMVRLDHKSPTLEEVSGIAFAPEVEEVVSNCLKKDPADRFQNVAELESALDEAYELCCRPEGELAEGESDKASDLSAPDSNLAKQPDPAICSKPGDWLRMGLLAGLVAVCVSTLLISGVVSLRDTSELISVGGTSQTPVGDEATILDDSISIGSELEDGIVWTRLHGPCVSRDVSRVLGVKNLQYLRMTHDDLSDNGFEILVERRVLLRGLKLDCCILGEATLRAIGRIRTLEFLELNECKGLSGGGLSYVQSCRRLKDLELADTDSGDNCVADIARLTNLQTVNLSLCKRFHGRNIDGLRVLGRLETLRLSKSGFQPDQIGKLVSLEHLKKLELARLSLDDDDIKKISGTSVRKIDLSNNRLTDRALWSLDGMSSLEDLNIEGNPGITETGARRFLKRHPHCKMHFHRETYRQLPNFAKT